jgi:hypothetical protein
VPIDPFPLWQRFCGYVDVDAANGYRVSRRSRRGGALAIESKAPSRAPPPAPIRLNCRSAHRVEQLVGSRTSAQHPPPATLLRARIIAMHSFTKKQEVDSGASSD